MDFTLISRAGLTQAEFAHLCGVSRVTVSLWVNGHAVPHYLHDGHIAGALAVLQRGLADNRFPVKVPLGDAQRAAKVHDAYWETAQAWA